MPRFLHSIAPWKHLPAIILIIGLAHPALSEDIMNKEKRLSSEGKIHSKDTPEFIMKEGNHLKNEKSLYLQMHSHNPVNWYPWGQEALEKARELDRPIFLSIGYSSCHWCHVMEDEVFSRKEVASVLNENFISIKVDREERPDIDSIYMNAVVALTGSGGWPLSVFLTPDQKPFFGGTYFPRDQFLAVLAKIHDIYTEQRSRVENIGDELVRHASYGFNTHKGSKLTTDIFHATSDDAKMSFDPTWGGFAGQMKFPMPVRWSHILHQYRKTGDEQLAHMIRLTLDKMASGGIHDHVGGGFHRYSVDPEWVVPHFEKMLYDNAQLANLYLEASVVLNVPRYAQIAKDTLDFMCDRMHGPGGGMFASLDADSGGSEGLYYLWNKEQLEAVAGKSDGEILARLLGVTSGGNFDGMSVLTRRADPMRIAQSHKLDAYSVSQMFDKYKGALARQRESRPAPTLDRKIITSWNGLAISALATGFMVLGDKRYLDTALEIESFLLHVHRRKDGALWRSSNASVAEHGAVLDDYAFLSKGLLDLYKADGDVKHLETALDLISYTKKHFSNPSGGFYFTHDGVEKNLIRTMEISDGVRPSANSVMLDVMLHAATITSDEKMLSEVNDILGRFSQLMKRSGLEMAGWDDVALKSLGPFYDVVIAEDLSEHGTDLTRSFFHLLAAHAVLVRISASGPTPKQMELIPATKGKSAIDNKATAFVCRHGSCKKPTSSPDEMRELILEGWKH